MTIDNCNDCGLRDTAKLYVPGVGPQPCRLMIVGEAPGAREDWMGQPFVGDSGHLLDALLKSIGLSRDDVYITNLVKYRPPKNRNPKVKEIKACQQHLTQELAEVRPEFVVTMGAFAAKWFDKSVQLKKDHGKPRWWSSDLTHELTELGCLLVPMYHPAYALRNPLYRTVLIEDFQRLRELLNGRHVQNGLFTSYKLEKETRIPVPHTFGFDTETTAPELKGRFQPVMADIVGYSVSEYPKTGWYTTAPVEELKPWLEGGSTRVVCHNTKFEYTQLAKRGIWLNGFEDTKLAAYLLGYPSTHLKHLTKQLLDIDPITYEDVTGGKDMSELDPAAITEYAAADADHALQLWNILAPQLDEQGLRDLYENVEKPLIPVLSGMERRGVLVDEGRAQEALDYFQARMDECQDRANDAGLPPSVLISSTDQMGAWLDQEGAPVKERTGAKNLPKTDFNTLTALAAEGWQPKIMSAVMDYKMFQKLRAFPQNFLDLRHPDGALHPNFNQAGHYDETTKDGKESPATGRLSCSSPNLQQIPHHGRGRGEEYAGFGDRIRRAIVARPGMVFVAADVGQQEPRITGIVANERSLLSDFKANIPIYAPMGEAIYGYPIDKHKNQHEWHTSKTYFLALVYGADWSKLMEIDPSMTEEQARRGHERITSRYRDLTAFRERVKLELDRNGYVRDYFGRIRRLPGWFSSRFGARDAALREGVNMHIQGPAATMIKIGMQRVHDVLEGFVPEAGLVLQIHDEVIVEAPEAVVPQVAVALRGMVDGLMPIEFPLDVKVGKSLGEMEEYS